jgi:uncharacterized protein YeaO (DUF488 family)
LTLFSAQCYSVLHRAEVAQLVEQSIRNRQVSGSSPDFGSIFSPWHRKMIKVKRIYVAAEASDGYRILVDRLWPRGMSKEKAKIDLWLKEIAPSDALRKWFGHEPERWDEFQVRYRKELKQKKELLAQVRQLEKQHRNVTLLYGARDESHNEAVALVKLLKR